MVMGDIFIWEGPLTIEPGVTVIVTGAYKIQVSSAGCLYAVGTATDSIRFTTDTLTNPDRWRGLVQFNSRDTIKFEYCTIENARADGIFPDDLSGGAVYVHYDVNMRFRHCLIRNNEAAHHGGGVYAENGNLLFDQCIFSGNTAGGEGGGAFIGPAASMRFTRCTFAGNRAAEGGGVANWAGQLCLNSTIIAFNDGAGLWCSTTSAVNLPELHSCGFYDNTGGPFEGPIIGTWGDLDSINFMHDSCDAFGDIFLDPRFVDRTAGDFHLLSMSPCINAGDTSLPRDADGTYTDIGAFPFNIPAGPTHVAGGSISGLWTPRGNPYRIEGNVTVAAADSLRINPGVIVDFAGPYSFTIHGKLLARGTETEYVRFTTDTLVNPDRWRGLRFVHADSASRMEYCIVESGRAVGTDTASWGGGIYCENTSCHFTHCLIQYNSAFRGGGAYLYGGSLVFDGCDFWANGGGLGGGLYLDNAIAQLISCRIFFNHVGMNGAGIAMTSSAAELQFTVVSKNCNFYSTQNSAAISCSSSAVTLIHCTVAANNAFPQSQGGVGMYLQRSVADINSSIFAFNTGSALQFFNSSLGQVRYSDFYGQVLAEGNPPIGLGLLTGHNVNADSCDNYFNILLDPLLVDLVWRDFHLQPTSPCIHAGDPALPHDPDETVADMGAFSCNRPYALLEPFDLLMPCNGDTVTDTNRVCFFWRRSLDADRGDTVTYTLYLRSGNFTWTFPTFSDTFDTVDLSGLVLDLTEPLVWWVTAHSHRPDTYLESAQHFSVCLIGAGAAVRENNLPRVFALYESSPNPFNAVTAIHFDVPRASRVKLVVYDVLGREATVLRDGLTNAGTHRVLFDAGALPSGVYFCRMTAEDFSAVKKLLLVK